MAYEANIVTEFARQTLTGTLGGAGIKWTDENLLKHFRIGKGRNLTLSEIGHLRGVIDYYAYTLKIYERVNGQIADEARRDGSGHLQYDFIGSYEFRPYLTAIGGAVVSGLFSGVTKRTSNALEITGKINYKFRDHFTDIYSLRELFTDSSELSKYPIVNLFTDGQGDPYFIEDTWQTEFQAMIYADRSKSKYFHKP